MPPRPATRPSPTARCLREGDPADACPSRPELLGHRLGEVSQGRFASSPTTT